jgi:hypothetical protein
MHLEISKLVLQYIAENEQEKLGIASIWAATAELPSVIAMRKVICQSRQAS